MKIELFKFKKSYKKKDYQINPSIYWTTILVISALMIVVSVFYGLSVFFEINKDFTSYPITTNDQTEKNREIRLENALQYFSEREKKSESIMNSSSPVVDPSL